MQTRTNLAVVTVVTLALTGCGTDDENPDPPPTTPIIVIEPDSPPSDCPASHTQLLELRAETLDEFQYLDDIVACTTTSGTSTWIVNHSDVVWLVHTDPGGYPVTKSPPDLEQDLFRTAASELSPDQVVLEPESNVTVDAPFDIVSWEADPSLTAAWHAGSLVVDTATDYVLDASAELLGEGRPRRTAYLQCAFSAASAVADVRPVFQEDVEAAEWLEAASGMADTASDCGTALRMADTVDTTEGRLTRPILEETVAAQHTASWRASAGRGLKIASAVTSVVRLLR